MPALPPARIISGRIISGRIIALLAALLGAAALGIAFASEWWGGLVPCALCLWERWPYRIVIALGLLAAILPGRFARAFLVLLALSFLAAAGLAAVHTGVEFGWWPSPLPQCAARGLGSGSIADMLASMPLLPAKPCDEPTYLIAFLPVSMAAMNMLYALGAAALMGVAFWRRPPTP